MSAHAQNGTIDAAEVEKVIQQMKPNKQTGRDLHLSSGKRKLWPSEFFNHIIEEHGKKEDSAEKCSNYYLIRSLSLTIRTHS